MEPGRQSFRVAYAYDATGADFALRDVAIGRGCLGPYGTKSSGGSEFARSLPIQKAKYTLDLEWPAGAREDATALLAEISAAAARAIEEARDVALGDASDEPATKFKFPSSERGLVREYVPKSGARVEQVTLERAVFELPTAYMENRTAPAGLFPDPSRRDVESETRLRKAIGARYDPLPAYVRGSGDPVDAADLWLASGDRVDVRFRGRVWAMRGRDGAPPKWGVSLVLSRLEVPPSAVRRAPATAEELLRVADAPAAVAMGEVPPTGRDWYAASRPLLAANEPDRPALLAIRARAADPGAPYGTLGEIGGRPVSSAVHRFLPADGAEFEPIAARLREIAAAAPRIGGRVPSEARPSDLLGAEDEGAPPAQEGEEVEGVAIEMPAFRECGRSFMGKTRPTDPRARDPTFEQKALEAGLTVVPLPDACAEEGATVLAACRPRLEWNRARGTKRPVLDVLCVYPEGVRAAEGEPEGAAPERAPSSSASASKRRHVAVASS